MSEIKTDKISPRTDNGTVTIGDAGDSIDFSGADKLRVPTSASAPSSPSAGDMYYNTTDNIVYNYTGTAWAEMSTNTFVATGGTETTSGPYKIHTFTSSGTFTVSSGSKNVEYLIVAGGGAGGGGRHNAGGGGAGGMLTGITSTLSPGTFSIVVGAGGAGRTDQGYDGVDSSAFGYTAVGGGGGGGHSPAATDGRNGGSGGGGSQGGSTSGSGTAGQGNKGGADWYAAGGGGGGAGGAVPDGVGNVSPFSGGSFATCGGPGRDSSISGSLVFYSGGGGAGQRDPYNVPRGRGGIGGGGDGGPDAGNGSAGAANTGGGGGGSGGSNTTLRTGGAGGSGIVIIRYPV